jgi:hypothetical protein
LTGMNRCFVVLLALAGVLIVGCGQQAAAPSSGQSVSSPSPAPTAAPASTAATNASPLTAPTPTPTPESQATPTATPQPTPPTPAASPPTTPDAGAPSPTSSPSAAESDGRPTLSSRSANEYLQSYDAYISDFKSAYTAMKQGDVTKYQSVIQRALDLQTKSEKLAGELNPEEEQRFANYLNKKANELAQFASENR